MKNLGYIALHRKLLYSNVWKKTKSKQHDVINVLLLKAQHAEQEYDIEGTKYLVGPGELITTYNSIQELCGSDVNYNDVRSAIKKLIDLAFLTKKNVGRKNSPRLLIQIINWGKYQNADFPLSEKDSLPPKLPGKLPPEQSPVSTDNKGSQKKDESSFPPGFTGELPPPNGITGKITGESTGKVTAWSAPGMPDNKGLQKEEQFGSPPENTPEKTGESTRYINNNVIEECSEECIEEDKLNLVGGYGSNNNYNNIDNNNIGDNPGDEQKKDTHPPDPPFSIWSEEEDNQELIDPDTPQLTLPEDYDNPDSEWAIDALGPPANSLTEEQKLLINEASSENQPPPINKEKHNFSIHFSGDNLGFPKSNLSVGDRRVTNEPTPVVQSKQTIQPDDYSDVEITQVAMKKGIHHPETINHFIQLNREKYHFQGGLGESWDKFIYKMDEREIQKAQQTEMTQPDEIHKKNIFQEKIIIEDLFIKKLNQDGAQNIPFRILSEMMDELPELVLKSDKKYEDIKREIEMSPAPDLASLYQEILNWIKPDEH